MRTRSHSMTNFVANRQTLEAFLQEQQWQVTQVESKNVIRLVIPTTQGEIVGYAHVRQSEKFIFYAMLPLTIPVNQRTKFAELVARLNNIVHIGNFEIDDKDGELRYKTSYSFKSIALSPTLVQNLIQIAITGAEQAMGVFVSVLLGEQSLVQAVARFDQHVLSGQNVTASQLHVLKEFFDKRQWSYRQVSPEIIRFVYVGDRSETYFCYVYVRETPQQLLIYVNLPVAIKSQIETAISWSNRINYGLWLGHFRYNFEEGIMIFQHGLPTQGVDLNDTLIENTLFPALTVADRYLPNLREAF